MYSKGNITAKSFDDMRPSVMILTVNLWDQLGILQNKFNICRFSKDCIILAWGSESTLKIGALGDDVCGSGVDEKEGSLRFFSVKIIYFACLNTK